ncbi:hypothetical protein KEM48_001771 [Puccinia striiformis f. sp. tritici PST-130]|nr:hypothetical protein KEM48_001771 [Puccinia striiformis f. sp. tritici PST-130]
MASILEIGPDGHKHFNVFDAEPENERDGPQPQMQLQQRQQQLQMQHQQNNGGQDNGMPNPYMLPQVEHISIDFLKNGVVVQVFVLGSQGYMCCKFVSKMLGTNYYASLLKQANIDCPRATRGLMLHSLARSDRDLITLGHYATVYWIRGTSEKGLF